MKIIYFTHYIGNNMALKYSYITIFLNILFAGNAFASDSVILRQMVLDVKNPAYLTQIGAENQANIIQAPAPGNNAHIKQVGNKSIGKASALSALESDILSGNKRAIVQTGSGNLVLSSSYGNHNTMNVTQHGSNLLASIVQSGNDIATVSQSGTGHQAYIVQNVMHVQASITQNGSNQYASIIQQ